MNLSSKSSSLNPRKVSFIAALNICSEWAMAIDLSQATTWRMIEKIVGKLFSKAYDLYPILKALSDPLKISSLSRI